MIHLPRRVSDGLVLWRQLQGLFELVQYDFKFGDGPFTAAVCLHASAFGVVPKELSLIESKFLGFVVETEPFLVLIWDAIVRPPSDENIVIADLRFLTCVAQLHESFLRLSFFNVQLATVLVLLQLFQMVLVENGGHLIDKGVVFCLGLEHYNKSQLRILQFYYRPPRSHTDDRQMMLVQFPRGNMGKVELRRVDNHECFGEDELSQKRSCGVKLSLSGVTHWSSLCLSIYGS